HQDRRALPDGGARTRRMAPGPARAVRHLPASAPGLRTCARDLRGVRDVPHLRRRTLAVSARRQGRRALHTRARGAELPGAYGGDRRPLPVGGVAGVVRLTSARVDRRAGGSGAGGGDLELLLAHVVATTARGQPAPRGARREVLPRSYAALTRNAQRGLSPRSQHS